MAYGASIGFVAGKVMLPLMTLTAILVSMLQPEAMPGVRRLASDASRIMQY